MNLSVMSPVLNQMSLEEALKYLSSLGVDSLELGAGGYPGKAHMDAQDYLDHPEKIDELKNLLEKTNNTQTESQNMYNELKDIEKQKVYKKGD